MIAEFFASICCSMVIIEVVGVLVLGKEALSIYGKKK